MHVVDVLFVGDHYRTDVWVSKRAAKELNKFRRRSGATFLVKLEHYAEAGFLEFEYAEGPIRHEWDNVFRVAHTASLFRLVGFYGDGHKAEFICMDAFTKRGRRLSSAERDRINEVGRIKAERDWKKARKRANE